MDDLRQSEKLPYVARWIKIDLPNDSLMFDKSILIVQVLAEFLPYNGGQKNKIKL